MRRFITLVSATLATLPGLAQAATPCLTPAEVGALTQFSLPGAISGARDHCRQVLPADAYLVRQGAALAERYRQDSDGSWPAAKSAFLKLSANGNADAHRLLRAMPDHSLQQMASGLIQGLVTTELPLKHCARVDRMVDLLAPLPAANAAGVVATLVEIGSAGKDGGTVGKLSICAARP